MSEPVEEKVQEEEVFATETEVLNLTGYFEILAKKN